MVDKCKPPCKEIKDGELLLETCVDVNVTTVCTVRQLTSAREVGNNSSFKLHTRAD